MILLLWSPILWGRFVRKWTTFKITVNKCYFESVRLTWSCLDIKQADAWGPLWNHTKIKEIITLKLSQADSEGVAAVTFFWLSEALRPTTYVLHRQLDQALSSILDVPTPLTVWRLWTLSMCHHWCCLEPYCCRTINSNQDRNGTEMSSYVFLCGPRKKEPGKPNHCLHFTGRKTTGNSNRSP